MGAYKRQRHWAAFKVIHSQQFCLKFLYLALIYVDISTYNNRSVKI